MQCLFDLRDEVPLESLRKATSDLLVAVINEWHEPVALKVIEVERAGFVPSEVRAWRVEPKYTVHSPDEPGESTYVYFRGIDCPISFDGDHHDALVRAIAGGKVL